MHFARRPLLWSILFALARGQATTNATCPLEFGWLINTMRQSPCLIAAYLLLPCSEGRSNVPALTESNPGYLGPDAEEANDCNCAPATYNTLAACAICQGRAPVPWETWKDGCEAGGRFNPMPVPFPVGGTTIPPYATRQPNEWDRGIPNIPELIDAVVFASPIPSMEPPPCVGVPSGNTGGGTGSTGGGGTTNAQCPEQKTNIGAIVAGTVCGVIALLLFVIALVYLLRRRTRPREMQQIRPSHERHESEQPILSRPPIRASLPSYLTATSVSTTDQPTANGQYHPSRSNSVDTQGGGPIVPVAPIPQHHRGFFDRITMFNRRGHAHTGSDASANSAASGGSETRQRRPGRDGVVPFMLPTINPSTTTVPDTVLTGGISTAAATEDRGHASSSAVGGKWGHQQHPHPPQYAPARDPAFIASQETFHSSAASPLPIATASSPRPPQSLGPPSEIESGHESSIINPAPPYSSGRVIDVSSPTKSGTGGTSTKGTEYDTMETVVEDRQS